MTSSLLWTSSAKLRFTIAYFFGKFSVLWMVKRPKWQLFGYEMGYLWGKILSVVIRKEFVTPRLPDVTEVVTTRGHFHVRPGSHDAMIVSPAYEKTDFSFLFHVLDELTKQNAPVAFIDIGANIGAFTVSVARRYPKEKVEVWSVEPIPENMTYLKRNLAASGCDPTRVTLLPYALSSEAGEIQMRFSPGQGGDASAVVENRLEGEVITIPSRRGDSALAPKAKTYVMKIDVEGHEFEVLDGLTQLLADAKVCWLCIEDANRPEFAARLQALGFTPEAKRSPSNSWWKLVH